jgi:hypothetical protein
VTGADLRIQPPGAAAATVVATLCGACSVGQVGRTPLTDDQATALINGYGSIVVNTTNNPNGEISGPIVKVQPKAKTVTG